ncbi:MAG: hypothetical protein R3C59_05700 [Planctomycetaceae bacterium]
MGGIVSGKYDKVTRKAQLIQNPNQFMAVVSDQIGVRDPHDEISGDQTTKSCGPAERDSAESCTNPAFSRNILV